MKETSIKNIRMGDSVLFWTKFAAIGQAVGAVATFLAVIAALYLARGERAVRLRVSASRSKIVSPLGAIPVITIRVENVGLRKARVSGFGWSTGFGLRGVPWLGLISCHQLPDYQWDINESFPWEIEPGDTKSTFIKEHDFIKAFSEDAAAHLFRRLPMMEKEILLYPRVYVGVSTKGAVFGKVDKAVVDCLNAGRANC